METQISIRVENLTRSYGAVTAIRNLNFTVNRGEIVGFLGPNGAGKSTTMRILSGIMAASSGSAWVSGISVSHNPHEVKRRIGYMPENNPLPDDMRVVEYLRFRARLKSVPARKIRETVQTAMETCDLARTARRKIIGTLSKGFRQRVGIADALLGDPEVVIMDEPTIGLDPHQIQGIRRLIDSLRGRMTVILSSHILPEIERSCDRVIIINRGRVVASGTSQELREEFLPGHRFDIIAQGGEAAVLKTLEQANMPAAIIENEQLENERERFTLLLDDANDDSSSKLIQTLTQNQNGLTLHSLAPLKPNLEEIFLAATKRSWEETIDSSRLKQREPAASAES
ncbi:ABC transporter ATP-binding protein [Coraliomargarita akajimensis]|uniref:ABC transporter related protein n=1 Tax=Coraliomargarita akajimensis (strain DSM 45221 / IAM 15411 / JCM 23193 / KCTC 12865 / 04OKA010-24) TaxID=583355 RepID=D5EMU8_CORAD|nr:ABC transporter ATP-binding protein [Coraliomargarita akajimensis]ADE55338.1 ABC transporter related protein [Coraliomargarita akajimensis DSM 45221]